MSLPTPRIAILVDTATSWGRRTIRGILDYSLQYGPWDVWIGPMGQDERFYLPDDEPFDGVIARVSTQQLQSELTASQLPVVNVSGIQLGQSVFPRVCIDQEASASLALEHFKSRALKHFAYVGPRHLDYVKQHERAFESAVSSSGMTCHVYPNKTKRRNASSWHPSQKRIIAWLQSLPKPIGIYTWGFDIGRDLIPACRNAGLQVPHDVAILGGDYDELLSDASHPALSGILTPAQQIGYQAAKLLHQQIQGGKVTKKTSFFTPKTVVERLSTEVLAIDDPQTLQAIQYLQAHACENITVDDILRKVPMARRALERKFKSLLGRSPAKEICHIRIQRARKLLTETNLSMQDIAEACGYTSYTYLGNVFKKETGISPGLYRKEAMNYGIKKLL
jgi:LacI family transcriptional regulator